MSDRYYPQRLLKLKIKLARLRKERDRLDREISPMQSEFFRGCREAGFCSVCEEDLDDCRCVFYAATPGEV